MSRTASKRVNLRHDMNGKPTIILKHSKDYRAARSKEKKKKKNKKKKKAIGIWTLRLPRGSILLPIKLLRHLRAKVARALRYVSMTRRSSSRKVSSSSSASIIASCRSRSASDTVDSHRAEVVEDCIEFFNSSASSLSRSNSVSGGLC